MLRPTLLSLVFACFLAGTLSAQGTRTQDSTLTQKWTSADFGYGFMFPAAVKSNPLGTVVNKGGQTELQNFIIPGGNGSIKVQYITEERMVPKESALLDSMRYYDVDSTGRNGQIHRRVYILKNFSVQMDILLTDKGQKEYANKVRAIFDSFQPPANAERTLEAWRYGRDPKEYENGRN